MEDSDPETAIGLPQDPVLKTEDTLEEVTQLSPLSPDLEATPITPQSKASSQLHLEVRDSSTESDKTVLSAQAIDSSVPTTPGKLVEDQD